jgi:hypothetical protein
VTGVSDWLRSLLGGTEPAPSAPVIDPTTGEVIDAGSAPSAPWTGLELGGGIGLALAVGAVAFWLARR